MQISTWHKHPLPSLDLRSRTLQYVEDTQNNAKGFTSRFLWFFPEPVFCRMRDTVLTDEETSKVVAFKKEIGRYHTTFYHPIYKGI